MSKLFYFPLLLCLSVQACAQTPQQKQSVREKGLQVINRPTAEAYVDFLASDLLEGREAGRRGGQLAGDYIISCLQAMGIQPLYEGSYAQPFDLYQSGGTPQRPQYRPWTETLSASGKTEGKLSLRNIIGKIDGRNPDEYVIVGAHYDHLGIGPALEGDSIYNGADDNASGVSAVLQIARAFLATGVQPERTVLFAFWDGEEKGLLGSRHFVAHFSDLRQVKGYLNFDMIGRNNKPAEPTHVVYFYSQDHPVFGDWLKKDIEAYGLHLTPVYKPVDASIGGSDNVPFSRGAVPILWYHTDGHPDYHQPGDHADKLNYLKLVDITKASFLNMWNLANEASF